VHYFPFNPRFLLVRMPDSPSFYVIKTKAANTEPNNADIFFRERLAAPLVGFVSGMTPVGGGTGACGIYVPSAMTGGAIGAMIGTGASASVGAPAVAGIGDIVGTSIVSLLAIDMAMDGAIVALSAIVSLAIGWARTTTARANRRARRASQRKVKRTMVPSTGG